MSNICFRCGIKFSPVRSDQLFCSKHCRYRYYHNSDLVLTLKKKWFDMILSGVKTEEYREIKPYWEKRFINYFSKQYDFSTEGATCVWNTQAKVIVFRNGYGKGVPEFSAACTISEGVGKEEWGAEDGKKYYVLKIREIFGKRNIMENGKCFEMNSNGKYEEYDSDAECEEEHEECKDCRRWTCLECSYADI